MIQNKFCLILLLVFFQGILSLLMYPIHHLPVDTPLLDVDYAPHLYQTIRSLQFLSQGGRIWGYDPFFMAGFPTAVVNLTDNYGASFVIGFLSLMMPLALAVKVFIMAIAISVPLFVMASLRNLGLTGRVSLLGAYSTIILLNSFWFYKRMMMIGMYSFIAGTVLAFLTYSLYVKSMQEQRRWSWIFTALCGAFMLMVHPLSAVVFGIPALVYIILQGKDFNGRAWRNMGLCLCFVLLSNLFWIIPLVSFRHYYTVDQHLYFSPFGMEALKAHVLDTKNIIPVGLGLLALMGGGYFFVRKSLLSSASSIWFSSWIFFGMAYINWSCVMNLTSHLEPGRFIWVGMLSSILVFAFLAARLREPLLQKVMLGLILLVGLQIGGVFALVVKGGPVLTAIQQHIGRNLMQERLFQDERDFFAKDVLSLGGHQLISAIKEHSDANGRVLFEDHKESQFFWGSHFVSQLGLATNRQYIGGPHHWIKTAHSFASCYNEKCLGRSFSDWSAKEFLPYIKLYNVHWAVVHTPDAFELFDAAPQNFRLVKVLNVEPVQQSKQARIFKIYEVLSKDDFFIKGKGRVRASLDKLVIHPESAGELIIKYHYLETFKVTPSIPMERVMIGPDPVGFIRLKNTIGAKEIILEN